MPPTGFHFVTLLSCTHNVYYAKTDKIIVTSNDGNVLIELPCMGRDQIQKLNQIISNPGQIKKPVGLFCSPVYITYFCRFRVPTPLSTSAEV